VGAGIFSEDWGIEPSVVRTNYNRVTKCKGEQNKLEEHNLVNITWETEHKDIQGNL